MKQEAKTATKQDFKLTWFEARKCYRKMYKGKMYYIPIKIEDRNDTSLYLQCVTYWFNLKKEIDSKAEKNASVRTSPVSLKFNTKAEREELQKFIGQHQTGEKTEKTALELIDEYLNTFWHRLQMGQISNSTVVDQVTTFNWIKETFVCVEYPETYKKPLISINQVDAIAIAVFKKCVDNDFKKEKYGIHGLNKRVAYFRRFIEWAYEMEYLDYLPRNVKSCLVEMPKPGKEEPVKFSVEECRQMFDASSNRTKLFIALGLNLAATQGDIGSLTFKDLHIEKDENGNETGYIKRYRRKTKIWVEHKLWPVTLKLLKEETAKRTKTGPDDLMILTRTGKPVWIDHQKDDISACFKKIRINVFGGNEPSGSYAGSRPTPKDSRGFKVFRKSGSEEIFAHTENRELAKRFLAQSTDKHSGVTNAYLSQKGKFSAVFEMCDYLDSVYRFGELI